MRTKIARVLIGLLVAAQAATALAVTQFHWLNALSDYSGMFLALILWYLLEMATASRHQLSEKLEAAQVVSSKLAAELGVVEELRKESLVLRDEIAGIRAKFRAEDSLVHGKLQFYQGNFEAAAEIIEVAVREDPDNSTFRYWLGLSLVRAGRHKLAVPHLFVAARDSGSAEYLACLGEAEFRSRSFEDAEVHLSEAIKRGAKGRERRTLLGKIQARTDPAAARATCASLFEENPKDGVAAQRYANALIQERDFDAAIDVCDRGLGANCRSTNLYASRAEALVGRAEPNDLQRAEDDLRVAREKNPRNYNVYCVMASMLELEAHRGADQRCRSRALTEAIGTYQAGLDVVAPQHRSILLNGMCRTYLALAKHDEAEAAAKSACEADQDYPYNHVLLGMALIAARRWAHVSRAVQPATEGVQKFPRIHANILTAVAGLAVGETLTDLRSVIYKISTDISSSPKFDGQRREWDDCIAGLDFASVVQNRSSLLAMKVLSDFLAGSIGNRPFVDALSQLLKESTAGFQQLKDGRVRRQSQA